MVAKDLKAGQTIRLWEERVRVSAALLGGPGQPYVAYAAGAEMSCHLSLGWPMPARLLDLYVEAIWSTSGLRKGVGGGFGHAPKLINVLAYHGLDAIDSEEKDYFRDLAIRGGPFTDEERTGLLSYCKSDVISLERLLPKMLPKIDLPRALIRGRYMQAVTRMEWAGVPINEPLLRRLQVAWNDIKDRLIDKVDENFGVYEGGTFKEKRFAELIERLGISWPRLASGRLSLREDVFRQAAKAHPYLAPLALLHALIDTSRRATSTDCRLTDMTV